MNRQELLDELPNFYGTEAYHQYSALFRNVLLTDGAKFLAENAGGGAYWLMDCIGSYLPEVKDTFAVAKLVKDDHWFLFTLEDGNDNVYVQQVIEYSDFPLDEITLFVVQQPIEDKTFFVIMLSSEY